MTKLTCCEVCIEAFATGDIKQGCANPSCKCHNSEFLPTDCKCDKYSLKQKSWIENDPVLRPQIESIGGGLPPSSPTQSWEESFHTLGVHGMICDCKEYRTCPRVNRIKDFIRQTLSQRDTDLLAEIENEYHLYDDNKGLCRECQVYQCRYNDALDSLKAFINRDKNK